MGLPQLFCVPSQYAPELEAGAWSNQPCDTLAYVSPTGWDGTATLLLPLCMQRAQRGFRQPKQTATRSQKWQVMISVVQRLAVHSPLVAAVEEGSCSHFRHLRGDKVHQGAQLLTMTRSHCFHGEMQLYIR